MSPWAKKRKKIIYGILIAIILLFLTSIVIEKNFKKPTCFDKKQNGDEAGVDCGGSCNLVCKKEHGKIIKNWSKVIKISGNMYNIATSIENTDGENMLAVKYKMSVFSSNGVLIWSVKNMTRLRPLENKIIFNPYVNLGDNSVADAFIDILETTAYKKGGELYNKKTHIVSEKKYFIKNGIPTLEIKILNNAFFDSKDLEIVAIMYDKNKNIINFSNSIIAPIKSKEERKIFLTWQKDFEKKVNFFDIFINEIN